MNKFDWLVIKRLLFLSIPITLMLLFIFVLIDFSDNSDEFFEQGATLLEIFTGYYLNYIPDMARQILPVAVFASCLFITGQFTERLEITSLKAAGVSLYRISLPYILTGLMLASATSFFDAYLIPNANERKFAFEERYLRGKIERVENQDIFRQPLPDTQLRLNYFDRAQNVGYQVRMFQYEGNEVIKTTSASKMSWDEENEIWVLQGVREQIYNDYGYSEFQYNNKDTTLNVYPRDLARTSSDIALLTYEEAQDYIESLERSGAGNVADPKVKYYSRLSYPLSILTVTIIGFAFASVRRRGGRGVYIAGGLMFSFVYLTFMEIIKPFGSKGVLDPVLAATIPHVTFLIVGIILLISTRK
ncbi:LptF/LptG family permease [Balneola sp. MJW-20]|uniref:LptF/LptG family permease n=1 Tax=Gracilimonas aurantiaca TaxID=3234185 RepID=UPI0034651065